jgi:hypothetical protein
MKLKLWQVFLISLGIVSLIGSIFLGPSIGGELMGIFLIWGGIGFVAYSVAKGRFRKREAIGIGLTVGIFLFAGFSYLRYLQSN